MNYTLINKDTSIPQKSTNGNSRIKNNYLEYLSKIQLFIAHIQKV